MIKKRKKEITIIDMTDRLNIEIISATQEEVTSLQRDIEEIDIALQKRMQQYEFQIRERYMSILSEEVIVTTERDSSYFISKYDDWVKDRYHENVKNRLEQYKLYLSQEEAE